MANRESVGKFAWYKCINSPLYTKFTSAEISNGAMAVNFWLWFSCFWRFITGSSFTNKSLLHAAMVSVYHGYRFILITAEYSYKVNQQTTKLL